MVEKTMSEDQFCKKCSQRHSCREVYQQLGGAKGPSVVLKVLVAFLLPIIAFISALVVLDKSLVKVVSADYLRTVISFLLAASVTFALILATKAIDSCIARK